MYLYGGDYLKADIKKLKLCMANKCMNTEDLCKATKMPRPTVNNVISGRSVRPATIGRIAKALGVDVKDILSEED